jgi:hypothetical protein
MVMSCAYLQTANIDAGLQQIVTHAANVYGCPHNRALSPPEYAGARSQP